MDDKTKSIIAHLTLIGWIIALIQNQNDKGDNTSFYLRQTLGIYIIGVLFWLPIHVYFSWIISVVVFLLWVFSVIGAASGEKKVLPVVGDMFQQWFKGVS